jgi:hypothetical protein
LQTDGGLLRRRIHEFQPTPRFRFVLGFAESGPSADGVALEAIRVAKLSGFLTCALTRLEMPDEIGRLANLHRELHELDLDGYLIVPAAGSAELNGAVDMARKLLLNRRWRRLSRMLDTVVFGPAEARREIEAMVSPLGGAKSPRCNCEEGAQA